MSKQKISRQFSEKNFDNLTEEFILNCKVKNLSQYTIRYYQSHLKDFNEFLLLNKVDNLSGINSNFIKKFILHLQEKHENSITVNSILRATRVVLYFGMEQNYIIKFKISMVKAIKKAKETYTDDEIKRLIKKPNLKISSFAEFRNWVLVLYLLETGNRLLTVTNIKVRDVDFKNYYVVLNTTKNKEQQINPISVEMIKILTSYIKTWGLTQDDFLFPNIYRGQMTRNTIQSAIKRYNNSRGVKLASLHAFRHTFAKYYIRTNGNLLKLQALMGHKSLDMCKQYVHLYTADLQQDFAEHSIVQRFSGSDRIHRKN